MINNGIIIIIIGEHLFWHPPTDRCVAVLSAVVVVEIERENSEARRRFVIYVRKKTRTRKEKKKSKRSLKGELFLRRWS